MLYVGPCASSRASGFMVWGQVGVGALDRGQIGGKGTLVFFPLVLVAGTGADICCMSAFVPAWFLTRRSSMLSDFEL